MRFLLRMAFWLAIVLALLPSLGSQPAPRMSVSALDAMAAAKATVADLQAFCARQPDTCAVGSQTAVAFGHRAQAGAKLLYEYLNEQFGPAEGSATLTLGELVPLPPARPLQHALSAGDPGSGSHVAHPRREVRGNRPGS
jgi:Family of unknown function (DUF5330)